MATTFTEKLRKITREGDERPGGMSNAASNCFCSATLYTFATH